MPFDVINAGTTFQKMMDTIFASQIDKNMQIYVDDKITKSKRLKATSPIFEKPSKI